MSDSLFSPHWYRVAALTPRIRSHAQFRRHHYRGQLWYVLDDRAAGRHHRFTPAAYHFIARLDGTQKVQDAWDATTSRLGDDAPTQDEAIQLMGQLHAADVLQCDVPPDTEELFNRHQREQRQKWKKRLMNPLAVRFPLVDPDGFLETWLPFARPFFGWFGFLLWTGIVVAGVVLAVTHWQELSAHASTQALSPMNLLLLVIIYPVVKGLHELGHGFATKVWGGEVHEMGIMFLVFMPIPYVDATASASFPEKRRRISVSAAGMMVELGLAALAMFLWLQVEPGIVRDIALNVMLIGGISTVLFNGNPLLRFDGYYMFADAIDIPNLGSRSNKYIAYLAQRYLCGVRNAKSPANAPGEARWFFFYGIAAFMYRQFIIVAIMMIIALKAFALAVVLGAWAIFQQLLMPTGKALGYLFFNPAVRRTRVRAVFVISSLLVAVVGGLFLAPAPHWTRAEGVLWLPEQAHVRAGTDGFIVRLLVPAESHLKRGDAVIELEDPLLDAHLKVLEAQRKELKAEFDAVQYEDRVEAQKIEDELKTVKASIARARERIDDLIVRSTSDGILVVPQAQDLPGRFVHHGEPIAYVVDFKEMTARVVVPQGDVGLVRRDTESVEVRLADDVARALPATILREVPAASDRLPSAALGSVGGGQFQVDPQDEQGTRALDQIFQFDLSLPPDTEIGNAGGRVYVRFDHGTEPLAQQWYRSLRQLFLRQFTI
ncbi:MAG: HlyD family efflux transporter periplasmic adaptor subunit [Gammaproteobacteria bacterium]|nr:HlyD family efflux transporter periplasmic adaptor subunit [Gammaproteobacteria bacterium]NIO66148.1 HlyD family efflux transporter periplasmic adaptor subunit [Gammaproteobacteria bacterium]NIP45014.1 HlyD family efflux transporter periplasmic adaptor subunit [Gammaproteobacteria bacterium]NIP65122.1 HlyD family efflux transporter periplasmic adaptor subunit [Gammaproteobacteria bacterium]NIP87544.1 HlyD family efflux transporter periplasmic adaptor subunit [Gammaproteobacteria bacterium]